MIELTQGRRCAPTTGLNDAIPSGLGKKPTFFRQTTVRGPSKMVRLMTSVLARCGPWSSPLGAKQQVPAAVENAFWAAMLSYIGNPGSLNSILQSMESTAMSAYGS